MRERLSQEQWHVIERTDTDFLSRCEAFKAEGQMAAHAMEYSPIEALRALEAASGHLAAMTGAQTDRMMRDDGWRLLSIGRYIERLSMLSAALARGFETGAVLENGGFSAMVALFDSTITFHAQYQQRRDIPALLDLLVLDHDNPRSLSWVMHTLKNRLAQLADSTSGDVSDLASNLCEPHHWALTGADTAQASPDSRTGYTTLIEQLKNCQSSAFELSDHISRRYFSHATSASLSLGT